jgi:hypothetical protein
MQAFLAANQLGGGARRRFFVVVATDAAADERVVGGTVFSYVAQSNCGFSEYMLAEANRRGQGLGRALFEARKGLLDAEAVARGHPGCGGVFIEVESPQRVPPGLADLERQTALDPWQRLALFAHLGFRRVDIPYIQPALGPGQQPIAYLDLLFASWRTPATATERQIPTAWLFDTLEPIWAAWTPETFGGHLATLRRQVVATHVALLDPLAGSSAAS